MTDDRLDQLLRDLGGALTVEPSARFAHRVRAYVVATAGRRARAWRILTVAGGVLAAAIVGVLAWPAESPAPGATTRPSGDAIATAGSRSARDVSLPAARPAASAQDPAGVSGRRDTRATLPSARRPAVPDVAADPAIQVITNQGDVLRRVWQRVDTNGRPLKEITLPVDGTVSDNSSPDRDIVLKPVTIAPIVVDTLEDQAAAAAAARAGAIRRDVAGRQ